MIRSGVKAKNANAGFSLVELMVVVAIIGILASIAMPQFQKFTFRARMTEAKGGLTSLYTAEKAFYAEWAQYDVRFGIIGYSPEGNYYFNIGFTSAPANPATVSSNFQQANNLTGVAAPTGVSVNINTLAQCPAGGARCASMASAVALAGPTLPAGFSTAGVGAVNNAGAPNPGFVALASAAASLNPDGQQPNVAMSENKKMAMSVAP